jgi:glycosyltransferase involved in cell wall biosynthesis
MNITYIINPNTKGNKHRDQSAQYIAKALENKGCKITYLTLPFRKYNLTTAFKFIFSKDKQQTISETRDHLYAKKQASKLSQLIKINTDIIFSTDIDPIAFLSTSIPIVIYTDSPFPGKNYMEQCAILNADLSIFSTEWSARNAIHNYKVDPLKIAVVPFGANVENPITAAQIKQIIELKEKHVLKLLFISSNWTKSAQAALEITEYLNEHGISTELHILGFQKNYPQSPYIKRQVIRSYADNYDNSFITELFKQSHFLLLPGINDCAQELISKASAYGLPVITSDTAGNSTIVHNNLNGFAFGEAADISDFGNYLADTFLNKTMYENLCLSSHDEYHKRLNWDTTAIKIIGLLEQVKLVHGLWTF